MLQSNRPLWNMAPIVVNSFGRSGSTLVHRSTCESIWPVRAGRSRAAAVIGREAWHLDEVRLRSGRVYKTHDYPIDWGLSRRRPPKTIYLFGDPRTATRSVVHMAEERGSGWFAQHCRHLGVEYAPPSEVLSRDCLQIERHFHAWMAQKSLPTLFVRYDSLWESVDSISSFLGFPLELEPKAQRLGSRLLSPRSEAALDDIYSRFSEEVRRLPDVFEVNGR